MIINSSIQSDKNKYCYSIQTSKNNIVEVEVDLDDDKEISQSDLTTSLISYISAIEEITRHTN